MQAATVVPGKPDSARVEEVADPPVDDGDILVDGLFVGVCGTDVEIVTAGYGVPPAGQERMTLFHESLGRVAEAPAGSGFAAGDLVVGVVRRPDPQPCEPCSRDRWDYCRNGTYTERGIKEHNGYGSQRWRVPAGFAVKLDPSIGDLGVLTEPTSVVAKAWDEAELVLANRPFTPRHVLVTGAGPIGQLAALLGVQAGLEVHVLDQVTDGLKPDLVRALGATYHSSLDDLGCAPDVVIEATGVGQLVFDVVQKCAPDAVVVLTGISSGTRTVGAALDAVNKEMVLSNEVLVGSVNAARRHYERAAQALAAADKEWLSRLVTRRVPLAEWPSALQRQPGDVKVVVDLQA